MPQDEEDFAQERISEPNDVTRALKTKKSTAKRQKGRSMDHGDDDAMLDEAIAEVRKLLDVQLSELKSVWRVGDPIFARCPENGGSIAPYFKESGCRCGKRRFAAREQT